MTPRQIQVKDLKAKGKSVKDIAKALKITPNAVYNQLRTIKAKEEGGILATPRGKRSTAKRNGALSAAQANEAVKELLVRTRNQYESKIAQQAERVKQEQEEIEKLRIEQASVDVRLKAIDAVAAEEPAF